MSSFRDQVLSEIKKILSEDKETVIGAGVAGGTTVGALGLAGGAAAAGGSAVIGAAGTAAMAAIALGQFYNQRINKDPKIKAAFAGAGNDPSKLAKFVARIFTDPEQTGVNITSDLDQPLFQLLKDVEAQSPQINFGFVVSYYEVADPKNAAILKKYNGMPYSLNHCKQLGLTGCGQSAFSGGSPDKSGGLMPPSDAASRLSWGKRVDIRFVLNDIWKKAAKYSGEQETPQPKPKTCPPGSRTVVNEKGETVCVSGPGPEPGPVPQQLKYVGCRKPQFVGKNGIVDGPKVESIQRALELVTMEKSNRGKFTYQGKSDNRGTFGPATEQAVYDFQKSQGGRYAAKIRTQLGSSLGNPDACVGPKTACALAMVAGGEIAGYDLAKCKARFGKKKIERDVLAKGEQAPENIAESKNWLDKTREKTASNLFERLVKDTTKKVI